MGSNPRKKTYEARYTRNGSAPASVEAVASRPYPYNHQMHRVRYGTGSLPLALALTTVFAYGLLLPLTGFYWDDWPFAWIAQFLGPAEFFPAFQGFRPFLAPIFYLTTGLLPANPVLWQIAALVIRFLAAWTAWWSLHQVWPTHRGLTVSAALLFLVFPGYSQHWVAFTHINQEWISLTAYLLSFGFSVRAFRHPEVALRATLVALGLQLLGLLPTEYFATMEPVRALLFWSLLAETTTAWGTRARRLVRAWWPYAVVWLLNGAWLFYYYRSGLYISYDLTATASSLPPVEALYSFCDALLKAGLYVWFQVIPLTAVVIASPTGMLTWVVILVAFVGLALYLARLQLAAGNQDSVKATAGGEDSESRGSQVLHGWHAIAIGVIGILLGRVPSFAANLPLTLQSSFDRLTISMMLGAALFVAGALQVLASSKAVRKYVLAALVALGVGQQFFNANIFRRDWLRQQEIYWQFAWRMPDLEPDTAILTQQMPLDYETDLAMTAALNWIYAREIEPPHLPFAVVYTEKRLGGVVIPALEAGLPMELPLRTMTFRGNTSQAIVVYVPKIGCLRVFDPASDDAWTYSRLPDAVTAAIPLSEPGRIITHAEPRLLPSPPFAAEPEHDWCYIYEMAELSRQEGDWQEIIRLREHASTARLEPADPFEWLPFVEAEARAGETTWAIDQTLDLVADEPKLERGLCALWKRVSLTASPEMQAISADLRNQLTCERW